MLAHLQYMLIRYKVSLTYTYCHNVFTKITLNLQSLFKHVSVHKNKAFCDTFPQNDPIYTRRWR